MGNARTYVGRKSSWQRTRPSARLLVGIMIITLVGLSGLTRKSLFGVEMIWPYAALWGAVGWASVGLAVRPMIVLAGFGIAQDVSFNAPIGSFVLVNLSTYAVAATLSETFDVESDPVRALLVSSVSMAAGIFVLWMLSGGVTEQVALLAPLVSVYLLTLILFVPLGGLFRLGARPGETLGGSL